MNETTMAYNASNLENTIASLQAKRNEMSSKMDDIKSTLRDNLLQAGMSGKTADALLDTMKREVDAPVEEYLTSAETFISQNQQAQEAFETGSQKTQSIAGR